MATTTHPTGEADTDFGLSALRSDPGKTLSPAERLRRLAGMEREDVGVIVVYAIAIGLVSLAVPIATQSLVNTIGFTALLQPVVVLATLVFVGLLAAGTLRTLQYEVVERLQQRFFVRATHDAVRRLSEADLRAFGHHGAPELLNRFLDIALVQKTAAALLLDGLSVVLQSAVSLVLLAFYHPALLAFDVVLILLIVFTLFGLGRHGVSTAIDESKVKYETAAWLEELAGSIRSFKAQGAQRFAFHRADELARHYVAVRGRHFKVLRRQIVASYALQALATAGLLGLGGYLVIQGQLTLGQLVAAELIVTGILSAVAKFGKYLENYYDLAASVDKIGHIVDLPRERETGTPQPRSTAPARLELEGVGFTHDAGAPALRDVSLRIAPGERLAILGSDASGKSTLVDLLYGLRAPTSGLIKIDGVDLRTLALGELREDIALVGRPALFDATVFDNLALGRPNIDAAQMARVLDIVALSDEIGNLPEGPATRLGHAGSQLTPSQAVRLTLARALLGEPRLLIIDDALDWLDPSTAGRVIQGIAAAHDRTTLLVFTRHPAVAAAVGKSLRLDRGLLSLPENVS